MTNETITSSLLDFYYEILRIRSIEERIASKYPEQKMRCPVHLSIGQEAVAVGVCKAALHSDYLISGHRAHAHYLAKGGDLKSMIAEIHGKTTGCALGRGGSMHLVDPSVGMVGCTPIIGNSIPVGVGLAFATQMKKENRIVIIFLGDAATEEGVFAECMNFAALKKLPVLFVCENNFFSVYSPLHVRQPKERDIIQIANGHGLWARREESGNDVEKVYDLAKEAMAWIREGKGPCFLEFFTYRYREHCGPYFDDQLGYRSEEEVKNWSDLCPIKLAREKLFIQNLCTSEKLLELQRKIDFEIDEAFDFAEKSPFPNPSLPQPLFSP